MKKLTVLILALVLAFALAACGKVNELRDIAEGLKDAAETIKDATDAGEAEDSNDEPDENNSGDKESGNNNNQQEDATTITKAEVQNFLKDDTVAQGIMFDGLSAKDTTDRIIECTLYWYYADFEQRVTYSKLNDLTKRYFNKSFTDNEIEENVTDVVNSKDEQKGGVIAVKDLKQLYLSGYGDNGSIESVDSIEMISEDTARISCTLCQMPDCTPEEKTYTVQFGKIGSQLYFKSIS